MHNSTALWLPDSAGACDLLSLWVPAVRAASLEICFQEETSMGTCSGAAGRPVLLLRWQGPTQPYPPGQRVPLRGLLLPQQEIWTALPGQEGPPEVRLGVYDTERT